MGVKGPRNGELAALRDLERWVRSHLDLDPSVGGVDAAELRRIIAQIDAVRARHRPAEKS